MSETFNVYDDSIISGSWSEKKNMESGSFAQETAGLPGAYSWRSAIVYNNGVVVVGDGPVRVRDSVRSEIGLRSVERA